MRSCRFMIVGFCLVMFTAAQAQEAQHYVILPASAAGEIAKEGTWHPTKADIDGLETNLSQVSSLQAENWKSPKIRIEHPEKYFRQYVAIIQSGKRKIYVNAFCEREDLAQWRKHLVIVDDGGTCFWQALYDPATKKFSHLRINGRA